VSATLTLRDYQRDAIDAVFAAWSEGMKRPAVVLPTGMGKTVVFSHLIDQFTDWWDSGGMGNGVESAPGKRVMVLVHRDELADQAIAKIRSIAPHLSVGKVKAQDNEIHADVMVCSVQTISRAQRLNQLVNSHTRYGPVGLIITDECHHAAAVSYQTVYDAFPDALHLGCTATMQRGDGVGLGSTWNDVVYSRSVLNGIVNGYLVDVKAHEVSVDGLDLTAVKTSRGDYQASDLGDAMEESGAQHVIAKAYQEHAAERQGIIFTPTVATAELTADALTLAGIAALPISGETPREERVKTFESFRKGECRVLVNCMVLTEGFDAPWASCVVVARPTQSQPLYIQMVGRGLRPWAGKSDCLVLNLNGAGGKLSTLIDLEPGLVGSVRDGETLTEAVEREEREGNTLVKAGHPAFGLKLKHVDLFAASNTSWLRTAKGVMFISAGEYTWFLWPAREGEPGTWDVCWVNKAGQASLSKHTGLNVEMAMAWAEAEAENYGSFSVDRSASWRRGKPSEAQLNFATALGVDADGMNKAELSDAISIAKESRRLDPFVDRA
jgi:ATP-dependent helicase IRC3